MTLKTELNGTKKKNTAKAIAAMRLMMTKLLKLW